MSTTPPKEEQSDNAASAATATATAPKTIALAPPSAPSSSSLDEEEEEAADSLSSLPHHHAKHNRKRSAIPPRTRASQQLKNTTFLFIKPQANNSLVRDYVESKLVDSIPGVTIKLEAEISGERIKRRKLLEQHYGKIGQYATLVDVKDVSAPAEEFEKAFNEKWSTVVAENRAVTAIKALARFQCSSVELETAWYQADAQSNVHKLKTGLYCGKVTIEKKTLYVINGFYMAVGSKYYGGAGGKSIRAYVVEWEESVMTWKDFRTKLIGSDDPSKAAEGSMRRDIYERYEDLGLESEPNKANNAIHASESPLVALVERCNWLRRTPAEDEFGNALLGRGIPESELVEKWFEDPVITIPSCKSKDDDTDSATRRRSLFDFVENMDSTECMGWLVQIYDAELFGLEKAERKCTDGCSCVVL